MTKINFVWDKKKLKNQKLLLWNIQTSNKMTTIKGKNLDVNLVTLADKPRQLDNGSKFVWAGYKGQKLAVQTPRMNVAFNMRPNTMGEYPKYSVELSFQDMDTDDGLQKFHDNIEAMDNFMIDAGVKNSMAWFKQKKVSRDVIEAKYSTMIKTPTDRETGDVLTQYPQRLRLKVPFYDGKFGCEVYGKDGNKMDDPMEEILVRGTRVKAIIECVGLWISASSYMCQWKVVRMEADVQKIQRGPAFLPDTDDEDGGESAPAESSAPAPAPALAPTVENDESDDDEDGSEEEAESEEDGSDEEAESDDDEDSEEETPPPPPEPVKKAKKTPAKKETGAAKKKK